MANAEAAQGALASTAVAFTLVRWSALVMEAGFALETPRSRSHVHAHTGASNMHVHRHACTRRVPCMRTRVRARTLE